MKDLSLLKPVLAQASLAFLLLFWMAKERVAAIRNGTVQRGQPGTRPVWVGRSGIVSNAFHNQLEMPILFYAVAAFALIADAADETMVWLAWGYVALRLVHALIHTTYNHIPHRFVAYLASNVILIAMWVRLGLKVMA